MTVDLNVPAQRHADVKNGLTVPPRLTFKTAADMIWRVPWAVSMLRTRHKTFGNLSGYSAAGVDMNNLASWIGSLVLLSAKASISATNNLLLTRSLLCSAVRRHSHVGGYRVGEVCVGRAHGGQGHHERAGRGESRDHHPSHPFPIHPRRVLSVGRYWPCAQEPTPSS